jgi:hypothetical protein
MIAIKTVTVKTAFFFLFAPFLCPGVAPAGIAGSDLPLVPHRILGKKSHA